MGVLGICVPKKKREGLRESETRIGIDWKLAGGNLASMHDRVKG